VGGVECGCNLGQPFVPPAFAIEDALVQSQQLFVSPRSASVLPQLVFSAKKKAESNGDLINL
jgi:hypothetical protein